MRFDYDQKTGRVSRDGVIYGKIRRNRFFPKCHVELDAEDLATLSRMLESDRCRSSSS